MDTLKRVYPVLLWIVAVALVLLGAFVGYWYSASILGGLLAAFVVLIVEVLVSLFMANASEDLKVATFTLGFTVFCIYFGWQILQWFYHTVLVTAYNAYIAWVVGLLALNPASVGIAIILAIVLAVVLVVIFARIVRGR